jgi:isopentenyl-diphosphate delta-isomerase
LVSTARKISSATDDIVSSENEELILVDADDREIGFRSKGSCHDRDGLLHRAFSLFVFNDAGELLLQRRAADKRLWPLYWSNSCCSHPRRGEDMNAAIHRRLFQELRIRSELRYLYKFQYQADFGDAGSERELCWVYAGVSNDKVRANSTEIANWRYINPADLENELAEHPDRFTPWFKLEWPMVRSCFYGATSRLESLLNQATADRYAADGLA